LHHPNGGAVDGAGGVGRQNDSVGPESAALVGRPCPGSDWDERAGTTARLPSLTGGQHKANDTNSKFLIVTITVSKLIIPV